MPWQWVNDLFVEGRKKDFNWNARCPYHLCPGNHPVERNSKLKFIQKVAPFVYQYKCGYCSCLVNIGVEIPYEDNKRFLKDINPLLYKNEHSEKILNGIDKQAK